MPTRADLKTNASIDDQIVALETMNPITHRLLREFMLGVTAMLKLDPTLNPAGAKVVAVDQAIAALRAQRKSL